MSRRGHRRVIAPPTVGPGSPSEAADSAAATSDETTPGAAAAIAQDSGEVDWFRPQPGNGAGPGESERDRWLREQRPPHWE